VLVATLLFNPLLAFVGAHIRPVDGGLVAVVQGAIVMMALGFGMMRPRGPSLYWLAVAWIAVMALALIQAIRAELDLKAFGNVLLIPAFIMLGTQLRTRTLIATVIGMQALILLVGIWELASPTGFGRIFKVASYYVQTRGYNADAFWAGGDLFLSAERPHGRFLLGGLGLHRGSSLFLEPVSLGNWTIVVGIVLAATWHRLSAVQRLFLILSNAALLVICDGRLALAVNLVLIAYLWLARRLPGWTSVFYLPVALAALAAAKGLGLLSEVGDNFVGRLGYSMHVLHELSFDRLLGIGIPSPFFADSGWAAVVQTQSIFVAIGLWLVVTLTDIGETPAGRAAKHGIALFLTLSIPISDSILSIKTAGLMWVCYGYCYARRHGIAAPA
jgi:putative polymerase